MHGIKVKKVHKCCRFLLVPGSQVHLMVQMLFLNDVIVFKVDSLPIHTARSVQSWFEEHEDELQHVPWSAQLPDLNIEPPWSVFESRVRSRILFHHLSSN
jgi:hypothetical protein